MKYTQNLMLILTHTEVTNTMFTVYTTLDYYEEVLFKFVTSRTAMRVEFRAMKCVPIAVNAYA